MDSPRKKLGGNLSGIFEEVFWRCTISPEFWLRNLCNVSFLRHEFVHRWHLSLRNLPAENTHPLTFVFAVEFSPSLTEWDPPSCENSYCTNSDDVADFAYLRFCQIANGELLSRKKIEYKVRKRAKIRNRYNQVPHLPQDTNGKVTTS